MQNLKVAGIQFDIKWKDKKANFEFLEKQLQALKGFDLIVLPEMFQTGFCFDVDDLAEEFAISETLKWLKEQAKKTDAALIGSFMAKEGGNIFNRLVFMMPNGDYHVYDKRHLFSMSDEPNHFTQGNKKLVVEYKGWKICPMVCYDLRFPVWIRNKNEYELLIFIANWPERRSIQWEKLLHARAIENQCYVFGINRVGNDGSGVYHDGRSAFIDPLGEPIETVIHQSSILKAEISKKHLSEIREKMPFLKDSDRFQINN